MTEDCGVINKMRQFHQMRTVTLAEECGKNPTPKVYLRTEPPKVVSLKFPKPPKVVSLQLVKLT